MKVIVRGAGSRTNYAAKYDPSGNFVWAQQFGGDANEGSDRELAVDGTGNVFVAGSYSPVLLYLAAGLGILSSLETLVLQLAFDGIDEEERSISRALQRRRAVA